MIDALGAQRSLSEWFRANPPRSQSRPEPAKKSFMVEEVEFGKEKMAVSMVQTRAGRGMFIGAGVHQIAWASTTRTIAVGVHRGRPLRVGVFVFYL